MRRETYTTIRESRHYHRNQMRKVSRWLQWSMALSAVLILFCAFFYLRWPDRAFYASNAQYAGFVIKLRPLNAPNASSQAGLQPSLPSETGIKNIDSLLPAQPQTTAQ